MRRALPLLGGRYEQREILAAGGQGCVVRAFDHRHGRVVVLKVRPAATARDRRSALTEAAALLDLPPHRGIAIPRDAFLIGRDHVLVMEDLDGEDLRSKLRRARPRGLPWTDALGWLDEITAALAHLHAQSPPVVHGDVTPANIVISAATGAAVLVDFGAAAAGSPSTVGYAAPELASGARSPAADVFALACTAHELLTGSTPHPGGSASWGGVPEGARPAVVAAIAAGLSVDPGRRPTAAGFRDALRSAHTRVGGPCTLSVGA
jgi:serine/threonine-protein kinase